MTHISANLHAMKPTGMTVRALWAPGECPAENDPNTICFEVGQFGMFLSIESATHLRDLLTAHLDTLA